MTLLLTGGVRPHVVQQIVGHSAIDVTMTICATASLEEKRKTSGRVGQPHDTPRSVHDTAA